MPDMKMQVGIEAHQQRREHGRAEHRDDVLNAHREHLRPGKAFVGADDAPLDGIWLCAPAGK